MTFAYRFGDVALGSDIPLGGLRADAESPADPTLRITLERSPAPEPDATIFSWPGRYATRLGTHGMDWRIDSAFDGVFIVDRDIRIVRLFSSDVPPHATCTDVFVRRILPRLIAARGATTLHAAAVAHADRALLLLGHSGAGKSTTTAALAATPGWDLLSDDLSVLWQRDVPVVAPGATGVCLWPNSREGLAIDPAHCVAMPGYDGKVRFDPPAPPRAAVAPLAALVFLARDAAAEHPCVTPMRRTDALIRAAQQMILFNPAAPRTGDYAASLARLNRALRDVPAFRLSYPSRFSALPETIAVLEELTR